MSYLLIVFILALVAAPLIWVKSTPRQNQVAGFRSIARSEGLAVSLCSGPGSRKEDSRLDHARYSLEFSRRESERLARSVGWHLFRNSVRGYESPWGAWRWLDKPACEQHQGIIGGVVERFSSDVSGFYFSPGETGFIWQEKGTADELATNIAAIKGFKEALLGVAEKRN